ncbi:MAG TPA: hypothetical protein VJU18_17130 [Vicinamibacteria bacterium]|nr:hypothetical protein [Vicinamibacteria bacterium]
MRLRTLLIALAVTLGGVLVVPGQAEARHRHGRHCRHSGVLDHRGPYWDAGWYSSYDYSRGYRYDRYHPYYDRYYDRYDNPYRYRSYRRFHLHGRVRCYRPHLSIHVGW